MGKTFGYFSVVFGLVGTLLLALDVLRPEYLKGTRSFLKEFSSSIRKARLIPRDKRVTAYGKTKMQVIFRELPKGQNIEGAYYENLKKINYKPDLNLNIKYRSFSYIISILLVVFCFLYLWYIKGFASIASVDGLKIFGFFIFIIIGLLSAWIYDALPEIIPYDKNLPPLYKIGRGRLSVSVIIFNCVQIIVNIIAKILGGLIFIALCAEKYTAANQSPRVLGIILIAFAFLFQFMAILLSK